MTADAGRSLITLTERVDWRVGEKIVIASTDFDPDQTEVRTITAISNGNRSLNLDAPLTYTHWGEFESGVVDERGEVALMSRNIVIRGDDTSTHIRTGGHMMFMADKYLKSTIHIDWVELTEMGWEGVLARYPMHFHECGDMTGCYIRSTSTHHCFNRVISIHKTNRVLFEDNFGFDTVGHMFYLEDGLETKNVFVRNLGILARTPDPAVQLKESDSEPSIFYITNLENAFIDNVAVGSDADGFWYHIPNEQWGNLYALIYAMPATFSGNVAHSNRRHGFYTDARVLAQDNDYPDFTAYKNNHFGVYLRTRGRIFWTNAHIADNASGFYPATEGLITIDDFQGTIVIDSCHFIGESNNIGTPDTPIETSYGRSLPEYHGTGINPTNELSGIELYDGLTICLSTTFENFQQASYAGYVRNAGAITGVAYENPWAIDPHNSIIAGTFINANPIYFRTATLEANGIRSTMVYDYDGSISGVPGTTYTADNPFFDPLGQSTFIPDYNALETPPTSSFAQLLFQIGTLSQQLPIGVPDFIEYQLGFDGTGPANYSGTPFQEPPGNLYDVFTSNLPVGSDVDVLLPDGAVLPDFTIGFRCSAPGESIIVRVPLADAPTNITYYHWAALGPALGLPVYTTPQTPDLAQLRISPVTAYYYDGDAGYLSLKPVLTTSFTNPGGTTIFDGGSTYILIEL
jgi:cell migration-inducing and hyaluronan-binding protein